MPIEKEATKIDKEGNESVVIISCKKQKRKKIKYFSARFTINSLSNLVDNLPEGIHKTKYKDWVSFLEYESVKYNLIKYKCLSCNKDYSNKIDEELKAIQKPIYVF